MLPIKLLPASAWRSYLGGKMIAELHGKTAEDDHFPEEWIISTVTARNVGREHIVEGLSMTPDGVSLKELIEKDPEKMLGKAHFERYGSTTGVLLKLLDAAVRLAVQVHPSKEKAKELFSSEFGKTECWHIIGKREINGEKPYIYLGFKEGVTREHWKRMFDEQNIKGMLDCLHKFDVEIGDTFLIEGGQPHAIGTGCFLVEIQEPTDYTIRTERLSATGATVPDVACHQGIGFEKMFDCFDYNGLSKEETFKRWHIEPKTQTVDGATVTELVGYKDTPMFKMEMLEVTKSLKIEKGSVFSGLYVLNGNGTLNGEAVAKGDQFFLPADRDTVELSAADGDTLRLLHVFGPKA